MLAKGADANVKNSVEVPVLVMAIQRDSARIVEALLKFKADPNVRDTDTDLTPLWETLILNARDRIAIVKMLLAAGADVNATIGKGEFPGVTPLMAVVVDDGAAMVQLFLDNGADVNARTAGGQTALSLAKWSKQKDKEAVVQKLLAARAKTALAGDAKVRTGHRPARSELVMSPGMRITATTPTGTIAITAVDELTRAYTWDGATRAVERSSESARLMGGEGAFHCSFDAHSRDHHGITRGLTREWQKQFKTVFEAMKWIREPDRASFVYRDDGLLVGWERLSDEAVLAVEVWQILIDGKKPTRLPGSQNDKIVVEIIETETSPLVKAVASNDLKAVTALLAGGADADVKNSVEVPVLVMAIRHGPAAIVEALLKNGADPNVRDVDTDWTPLIETFSRDDPDGAEVAKMLLAAGADMSAASRKEGTKITDATPLMIAAADGCDDLVQLFIDKGADVNAKMPDGTTALSMAKSFGMNKEDNKGVIRKLIAAGAKE